MVTKLRGPLLLLLALLVVGIMGSCVSYGYTLVTYNETTAKIREHEVLGTVTMEIHATSQMWKEEKGLRALLLEEAKKQFGDDVDDVVNVGTSQAVSNGFMLTTYFIAQGSAISYTGGDS